MDVIVLYVLVLSLTFSLCTSLNAYTNAMYNFNAVLDKNVIPLGSDNEPVELELGVTLVMVSKTESNRLAFDIWLQQTWKDARLAFADDKYTDVLHVPFNRIWLPDITGYNVASFERESSLETAVLSQDGTVHLVPKYHLVTYCDAGNSKNISCSVKLGSWVYSGKFITLKIPSETVQIEIPELSEFEVVGTSVVKESVHYECCPEMYESILITVNVTSRPQSGDSDSSMGSNGAMARKAEFSIFPLVSLICLFGTLWFKA